MGNKIYTTRSRPPTQWKINTAGGETEPLYWDRTRPRVQSRKCVHANALYFVPVWLCCLAWCCKFRVLFVFYKMLK